MYADRHAKPALKPGSLAVAVAINGAILGALLLAPPELIPTIETPFTGVNIPLPPPPPPLPEPPKPKADVQPKTHPSPAPDPKPFIPDPVQPPPSGGVTIDGGPPVSGGAGGTTGDGPAVTIDPPRAPLLIGPEVDPRFASSFQPIFPPSEQRAGNSGRVVIRVLIGVDGRVKQVERISAASDAFFQATVRRAMGTWRFKPATRDGIPVESWKTMSVSFVLDE